jgi:molybdopterin-containing oxidoreductase family membrane subunit
LSADSLTSPAAGLGDISPIRKRIFSVLSLGWRNTDNEWRHFARAYLFLAAFSTPLVLSVHSVVSFDFAMSLVPGWHTTIFAPYFVAGAIFSGIGMVFTIIIPLRKFFGLRHYVTINHLDAAAKLCLFTSLVVGCAYMTEWFVAWFSGNEFEKSFFANRIWGQWWWASAILYTCNMVLPLSLFVQKLRRNAVWLFIISFTINIGCVRALRDRRPVIVARIRAMAVDQLSPDVGGLRDPGGKLWLVLDVVPALHQAAAGDRDLGSEGDRSAEAEEVARSRDRSVGPALRVRGGHAGRIRLMRGVLGAFHELDAAVSAIEALKEKRVGAIRVFTPTPRHELEEAIGAPPSPVRRYTLIGGLLGVTFGYWIAIWASDYWPLVVGGKPIASGVPYTIFGFEVMVLVGALSTVAGLFISSRIPRLTMMVGYDPRFSHGDYGVWSNVSPSRRGPPSSFCVSMVQWRCGER